MGLVDVRPWGAPWELWPLEGGGWGGDWFLSSLIRCVVASPEPCISSRPRTAGEQSCFCHHRTIRTLAWKGGREGRQGWAGERKAQDSSTGLGSCYPGPPSGWVQTCYSWWQATHTELPSCPPFPQLLLAGESGPQPSGNQVGSPLLSPSPPPTQAFLGFPCFPTPGPGTRRVDRKEQGSRGWQVRANPRPAPWLLHHLMKRCNLPEPSFLP